MTDLVVAGGTVVRATGVEHADVAIRGGRIEAIGPGLGRDGVEVRFVVTDTAKSIAVSYRGALPDLFREGKGVVAQGQLGADGVFQAREVLAKHDENYMPPEAAHAVEKAQKTLIK